MTKKFEARLGDIPEGEVVLAWKYHCGGCHSWRQAHCATNGLVFDLKNEEPLALEGIIREGNEVKNVYQILELTDAELRETPEGKATIKELIVQAHMTKFHPGSTFEIQKVS